jgi:protein-disulfide isomerase
MGTQARDASRRSPNANAARQRGRQRQRQQKRRRYVTVGGGLIILALLVAIAVTLVRATAHEAPPGASQQSSAAPSAATAGGAIVVGSATAPVKVEIYLDYMCPFCGRFERANGTELERLVTDGTIRLELHPLAFLDKASNGTRYSTRAANAVATVADRDPGAVLAFSTALYAHQPAERSAGLLDDQIAGIASGAGVPKDVVDSFTQRRFGRWVADSTSVAFSRDGITGTPTVKVNGTTFGGDLYTAGPLTATIIATKDHS